MAVLGDGVLRIVDARLLNTRLQAILRVFGQVGQLDAGRALEPVQLKAERLAGNAPVDRAGDLVGD